MSKFTLAHGAGINDAIALFRRGNRRRPTGAVEGSARFYTGDTGVTIWTQDEELANEIAQRVRERARENKVLVYPQGLDQWWVIFTPQP